MSAITLAPDTAAIADKLAQDAGMTTEQWLAELIREKTTGKESA